MSLIAGDDVILGVASSVSRQQLRLTSRSMPRRDTIGGTAILVGGAGNNALQYDRRPGRYAGRPVQHSEMPLSPIAILAKGHAGQHVYSLTDAAERVNVFATIVDVVGQPLITYIGNEQLTSSPRAATTRSSCKCPSRFTASWPTSYASTRARATTAEDQRLVAGRRDPRRPIHHESDLPLPGARHRMPASLRLQQQRYHRELAPVSRQRRRQWSDHITGSDFATHRRPWSPSTM
jgi:hypothetical protein